MGVGAVPAYMGNAHVCKARGRNLVPRFFRGCLLLLAAGTAEPQVETLAKAEPILEIEPTFKHIEPGGTRANGWRSPNAVPSGRFLRFPFLHLAVEGLALLLSCLIEEE